MSTSIQIRGIHLTMVLPAPRGCNLTCPGCVIDQRNEQAVARYVNYAYYAYVLTEICKYFPVRSFSLQGHEIGIDDDTVMLARKLATLAAHLGIPRIQAVTNGITLTRRLQKKKYFPGTLWMRKSQTVSYAEFLSEYMHSIIVSINSADRTFHDKSRGKEGAFEQTIKGAKAAAKHFDRNNVWTAAILFPGKGKNLYGLPELIHDFSSRLYVSPFISGNLDRRVQIEHIVETMRYLMKEGDRHCLSRVALSDEFGKYIPDLPHDIPWITTPQDEVIVRITPDGRLAVGSKILLRSEHSPLVDFEESTVPWVLQRELERNNYVVMR